jgi:molybdate transport system ATP-binding protein
MTAPTGLRAVVDAPGRLVGTFSARPGEVVAVIGPNGAGKTTLVESVAGTLRDVPARVSVDDTDWTGLSPQHRSVGLVFQDHLLFPHLDARANVAFGLRARGASRRRASAEAGEWLDRLGVGRQADRRPAGLSGGQAQRVAVARALATGPRVLLLDEPFAALDVTVAAGLRDLLGTHLTGFTGVTLLATHDALDVRALADRVVVLEGGAVAQDDTPAAVAEAPATPHAARLLGLNVLSGSAAGTEVALDGGGVLVLATAARGPVLATFAPSAVTLTADEPAGSARNRWHTTVHRAVERDGVVRVHLQGGPTAESQLYADVTRGAAAELALAPGRPVWASVKATEVTTLGATDPSDR